MRFLIVCFFIVDSYDSLCNDTNNQCHPMHPFREGNGRTQRLFIEELAKNAGYELNLSNVSQSVMIQASIQGVKGNIKGYENIIKVYLKNQSIKIKSELEPPSEKHNNNMHPSPSIDPFKKPWER
jgi:hypothetical protein